jgi:hypothetical protein
MVLNGPDIMVGQSPVEFYAFREFTFDVLKLLTAQSEGIQVAGDWVPFFSESRKSNLCLFSEFCSRDLNLWPQWAEPLQVRLGLSRQPPRNAERVPQP